MTRTHWHWMGQDLRLLSEPQVERLLYLEMDGRKRRRMVVRLHQRLCALRAKRERDALMKELDGY